MIYAEIGIGNGSFLSTEIEVGRKERRIKGFMVRRIRSVYLRVWVGRRVLILDTTEGFKTSRKSRSSFKLLLGVVSSAPAPATGSGGGRGRDCTLDDWHRRSMYVQTARSVHTPGQGSVTQ